MIKQKQKTEKKRRFFGLITKPLTLLVIDEIPEIQVKTCPSIKFQ